ncbi:MAG: efflux RND transporter periplasmic adaptor subunit [Myxococcales bacterium]|nr:efflux RND transporter periplasmic adaptor subunit [Myxococcales bacterium]
MAIPMPLQEPSHMPPTHGVAPPHAGLGSEPLPGITGSRAIQSQAGVPHPGVSRTVKWVGVVLLLLVLVPLGLRVNAALKKQALLATERTHAAASARSAAGAPPVVEVVRPAARSWQATVTLEGTVYAAEDADLAFKATGNLSAVHVKLGDSVKKGRILAVLDATETVAQQRAAAAQLKSAQAQLNLVEDSERRTKLLFDRGAAAEAQAIAAAGQLALTRAQLDAARAQLGLTAALLQNHTLVAPFAGVVTRAPSTAAGLVAAGIPLFHLQNTARLRLVGTVGEADAALVSVGAVASLADGRAVTITAVLPSVDPATRRVPLEAVLDNDARKGMRPLRSGEFVRATIATREPVAVLAVPGSALRPGSQDELVLVRDGKIAIVRVVFARDRDGTLLVRQGLTADAAVVLAPTTELSEGAPITAHSAAAAVSEGAPITAHSAAAAVSEGAPITAHSAAADGGAP